MGKGWQKEHLCGRQLIFSTLRMYFSLGDATVRRGITSQHCICPKKGAICSSKHQKLMTGVPIRKRAKRGHSKSKAPLSDSRDISQPQTKK